MRSPIDREPIYSQLLALRYRKSGAETIRDLEIEIIGALRNPVA